MNITAEALTEIIFFQKPEQYLIN